MYTIAIDSGATSTRAALIDSQGRLLKEAADAGSNPVSLGVEESAEVISRVAAALAPDAAACIAAGVSGCFNSSVREALADALAAAMPDRRLLLASDLYPLLAANLGAAPGLVIISGTGSSVLAQNDQQHTRLYGGRGTVFGEAGGAYGIAESALRAAGEALDGTGPRTILVSALPKAAQVEDMPAMVSWAAAARKDEIADLARAVLEAASQGDAVAHEVVEAQARALARLAASAHKREALPADAPLVLHGGAMRHTLYLKAFQHAVLPRLPEARLRLAETFGPAACLALKDHADAPWLTVREPSDARTLLPSTEQRLSGPPLDALTAPEIVNRMNREDRRAVRAVSQASAVLARVVERAADAVRSGGRIIYIGAGTSGRLGVLDASECVPTFGVSPERVVGIMAGGDYALRNSVEGVEDDVEQGKADLAALTPPPGRQDIVVGIAASGSTPYVHGALRYARAQQAATALICCHPPPESEGIEDIVHLATGPEALTGSTRLKAGTATKMALNIISTGAMALSGYVHDGLMVRVRPVNAKLRRRTIRIIAALADVDEVRAERLMEEAEGDIRTAVVMALHGASAEEARRRVEAAGGVLRQALL